MDFWSHVALSTKLSLIEATSISALNRCSKPEISNLKIVMLIIENIFWLEISVCDALLMAVVETVDQLAEVETADWFIETTGQGNVVEKFTASS